MHINLGHVRLDFMSKFHICIALFIATTIVSTCHGQAGSSDPLNGATSPGLAPGAPAGSFPLSGFEQVNPFNGNVNFLLPLLGIGGRGKAQYSISAAVDKPQWRIETSTSEDGLISYAPNVEAWHPYRSGANYNLSFTPGALIGRSTGVIFICNRYKNTLTRLTWVAADGTEYELIDSLSQGQPHFTNPPSTTCNDPWLPQLYSRGTVFRTADGTSATFISNGPIFDPQVPDPNDRFGLIYQY